MINPNSPQNQFLNAVNQYIATNPNANLEVGELDGDSNPNLLPRKFFSHTLAKLTERVVIDVGIYDQLDPSYKSFWNPIYNLMPGSDAVFYEQKYARKTSITAAEVANYNLIKDAKLILEAAVQILDY